MAQASPTNILLSQAAYRLERLRREYGIKRFKAPDDVVEVISKALTAFEEGAGKSLSGYDQIHNSEVPNSAKMNVFWANLEADINILQQQIDLLRAGAVRTHNFLKTEIEKAARENLTAQNKLKTLQLYSDVDDGSLVYFGDTFITEDFIDWDYSSSQSSRMQIFGNQSIGLGLATRRDALTGSPKITMLQGSNGILGNNQEIVDPVMSSSSGVGSYSRHYYRSESYPANELDSVLDGQPATWLEFEKYHVSKTDRAASLNYNFTYKMVSDTEWAYLNPLATNSNTIDWADGLGSTGLNGTLVMLFEIDLKSLQNVNVVTLLPFGLEDNINNPIKVRSVSTSTNRSDWNLLGPQNVWLANSIDRKIIDVNSENIVIGQGTWSAPGAPIRYLRFEIEQPSSIQANIGHMYYYIDNNLAEGAIATRQLGPVPPVNDTSAFIDSAYNNLGNLVQRTEYFTGRRWAIGIRDIGVFNNTYQERGSFVSRRFDIPDVIDRVALDTEIQIPESWDSNYSWVRFFVSPNNGVNWFQISRIQDDFNGIPEIIAFNDPTPVDLREPGVAYHDVSGTVNSIRIKVEMERPIDDEFATALLGPYTLKIRKRN